MSTFIVNTETGVVVTESEGTGIDSILNSSTEPGVVIEQVAENSFEGVIVTPAEQGPTGPRGLRGSIWKGTWDSGTTYSAYDAVESAGSAYIAIAENTNDIPPSANWELLASKGDQGDKGANWQGQWVAGSYTTDDIVQYEGSAWIAIANTFGEPGVSSNWQLVASKGDQGIQGEKGAQWRGTWDSGTSYLIDDVVFYEGSAYIAVLDNTAVTPGGADTWEMVASEGDQGIQGIRGAYWHSGSGAPTFSITESGTYRLADYYLDTATGDIYEAASGSWVLIDNITGPQGIQGIQGIQGPQGDPAVTWRGEWNPSTAYVLDDAIYYSGSSWRSLTSNTNSEPSEVNADWQLIAKKGTDGSGAGDVIGPASSSTDNLAVFADSTGKLLKDSNVALADILRDLTVNITASEDLLAGDLVNIFDNAGTANVRKADATNGRRANGFVVSGATTGNTVKVYGPGKCNNVLTGLTPGDTYYLSNAAGLVSTNAPVDTSGYIHQEVGTALSASELEFNPKTPILLEDSLTDDPIVPLPPGTINRSLTETGLATRLWSFKVPGGEKNYTTPIGPFTVSNGFEYKKAILACSWDWHVYALDVTDGSQIWRTATGDTIYGRAQAGDINGDNRVEIFVPSHSGYVRRYDDEGVWDGWELQNVYDREGSGSIDSLTIIPAVSGGIDPGYITITDSSQNWAEDAFVRNRNPSNFDEAAFNAQVEFIDGPAIGESLYVKSVNGSELVLYGLTQVAPQVGDSFVIYAYAPSDTYFMHAGQLIQEGANWFLYVTSFDSHIYKVNANTGAIIWKYAAQEQTEPWPWVGDLLNDGNNKVIYGNLDGFLRCRDGNTGTLEWETELGGMDATPYVAPTGPGGINEVFISGRSGKVYRLESASGNILAESGRPQNWRDISSSALPMKRSDNEWQIVTGGNRGNAQAFDLDMFNLWSIVATQDNINSTPKLHDVTGNGKLDAIIWDMVGHGHIISEDGYPIGKMFAKGSVEGMPLVADIDGDGQVEMVVSTLDGYFHCFRFTNGSDLGTNGQDPNAINMPIVSNVPDFSPENIILSTDVGAYHDMGPNAVMWQDAAKTISAGNGDPVAVVEDLSGNGYDWVAPITSARPTRVINGSEGYLLFDGTDDKMEILGSESTFSFLHKAAEHSLCVAVRPAETTNDIGRGIISSAGADPSLVGYDLWHDARFGRTNLNYESSNGGSLTMSIQDSTIDDINNLVLYTNSDASASRLRINNGSINALAYFNTPSTANSSYPLTLGHLPVQGGFFLSGRIYGTFIIDKDLRNVDRNEVVKHLGDKIGVSITVN